MLKATLLLLIQPVFIEYLLCARETVLSKKDQNPCPCRAGIPARNKLHCQQLVRLGLVPGL